MADPEGINWLVALGIILIIVAIVAFILFIIFLISDSIDNVWAWVALGVAVLTFIFGGLAIAIGWFEKEKRRGKYEGRVKKKKKEDEVVTFYPESGRDYVDVSTSLASFGRPRRRVTSPSPSPYVTSPSPYAPVYGAIPPARPVQPPLTPSKWTYVQPEIKRPLRSPPKVSTLRPSAPEYVSPQPEIKRPLRSPPKVSTLRPSAQGYVQNKPAVIESNVDYLKGVEAGKKMLREENRIIEENKRSEEAQRRRQQYIKEEREAGENYAARSWYRRFPGT